MISERIAKRDFIVRTLNKNFTELRSEQEEIYVSEGIGIKTGDTLRSIQSPFVITQVGELNFVLTQKYAKQLRFLDMKKYGNHRIYNTPLWHKVWNRVRPEIKYGYGNEVTNAVGRMLEKGFEQERNIYQL